jgi:hypothetical protein
MITALQLIFSPFETWEKIATSERGFLWILAVYLLPLLAVALGIEGYLLTRWGEKRGELGYVIQLPVAHVISYSAAYCVILLAAIFVSAKFLSMTCEGFTVRATFYQCFVVIAYGFGPIIWARAIDGFPHINTWVCWAIGTAAAVSVLYHGVGMVMKPEQTKGFGLYLMSILIVVVVSGLAHFAALSILRGKVLRPSTVQVQRANTLSVAVTSHFRSVA